MYEFSKTEHAQKTPVQIANEGQRTGADEYPPRKESANGGIKFVNHTNIKDKLTNVY